MKDEKHHLKHLQKKVVKSAKKEKIPKLLNKTGRIVELRRPKPIMNKRKIA